MGKQAQTARAGEAIRDAYALHGVGGYYTRYGAVYRNPHERAIRIALAGAVARWPLDLRSVLDLACGSGEVTLALRELGAARVMGADPFTGEAYRRRTGEDALPLNFEAIAAGALAGRRFSLIVCAYALHLVERSRFPQLCYQLSRSAEVLLVLTPHKRPEIDPRWGWAWQGELLEMRVRARYYTSTSSAE